MSSFLPLTGLLPVLLFHLAGSKQLLDLMCHVLLPGQHHYTRGFFVQAVAQMQRLCLVATKHLCQDGQHISDAELDSRATYDGESQKLEFSPRNSS